MTTNDPEDVRNQYGRSSVSRKHPIAEVKNINGLEHAFTPHFHDELQVAFVRTGKSKVLIHERHLDAKAGSTVCIPPHIVHSCNPDRFSQWAYTLLLIHPEWLRSVEPSGRWESIWVHESVISTTPPVVQCLAALEDARDLELKNYEGTIIELCAALWDSRLADVHGHADHRDFASRIAGAEEYLRRNRSLDVSLDELSNITSLSKYHLVRSFETAYGLSPHAYQLNLRVNRARELLSSGVPIVDVAIESGFSDQSHFTKVFSRHVGMNPGAFRKQQYLTRTGSLHTVK